MRQLFCDWHLPAFLDEIAFDYDEYFRGLVKTGAQALIFQAKNAHGNSLYPTRVGTPNPGLRDDLFGEVCRRAKARGLQFIAYYNVVLSHELGRTHPEWQQVDWEGRRLTFEHYPMQCMSNDHFREYVYAQMEEIASSYEVDGFFLDLQYFHPRGCACDACHEKFRARWGRELEANAPESATDWLRLIEFQVEIREAFLRGVQERCAARRPGLTWSWNHAGDPNFSARALDTGADWMAREAHPPGYLEADLRVLEMMAAGKPAVLMMPESQGSWGDWTLTTVETLQGFSALALAHGGALNINHVPYPCGAYAGRVPPPVWDTLAQTLHWTAAREAVCRDKRPVPVVGCPISEHNLRLSQALGRVPDSGRRPDESARATAALHQLLSEAHLPLGFFYEEEAAARLSEYELIVLPLQLHVGGRFADALRSFVAGGGKVLGFHETSLLTADGERLKNLALADLFGLDLITESPYSVSYLDRLAPSLSAAVPAMPLLIKDRDGGDNPRLHAFRCRPRPGTRVLAYQTDPVLESDFAAGRYIYHQHAPPGECTGYPAISVHPFGRGLAAFVTVPFLQGYRSQSSDVARSPFLRQLFRAFLEGELGVSTRVRVEAPVSVKMTLMQDDEGWLLHLLHVQRESDSMYLDRFRRPGPVRARVAPGWPVVAVENCLTSHQIRFETDGDAATFDVSEVLDHEIIRIRRKL